MECFGGGGSAGGEKATEEILTDVPVEVGVNETGVGAAAACVLVDTHSDAPAIKGVAMLVPLSTVRAQLTVGKGSTEQWLSKPAACAACVSVPGLMPAHADEMASPGATMSGLKRASMVGPLLENAAKLLAEGARVACLQGWLQQVKQMPLATTASQQSCISHVDGDDWQQRGWLLALNWLQNELGSVYTASAATWSAFSCVAPTDRQFLQVAGAPTVLSSAFRPSLLAATSTRKS